MTLHPPYHPSRPDRRVVHVFLGDPQHVGDPLDLPVPVWPRRTRRPRGSQLRSTRGKPLAIMVDSDPGMSVPRKRPAKDRACGSGTTSPPLEPMAGRLDLCHALHLYSQDHPGRSTDRPEMGMDLQHPAARHRRGRYRDDVEDGRVYRVMPALPNRGDYPLTTPGFIRPSGRIGKRTVALFLMRHGPETLHLYIVRHGETAWNQSGLFQGRKDSPLTPTGMGQAVRQGQILGSLRNRPRSIVSKSPGACDADRAARPGRGCGHPAG